MRDITSKQISLRTAKAVGFVVCSEATLNLIKNKLGFKPTISFEEGILLFCNWVQHQSAQIDNYEQSLAEMKAKGLLK